LGVVPKGRGSLKGDGKGDLAEGKDGKSQEGKQNFITGGGEED